VLDQGFEQIGPTIKIAITPAPRPARTATLRSQRGAIGVSAIWKYPNADPSNADRALTTIITFFEIEGAPTDRIGADVEAQPPRSGYAIRQIDPPMKQSFQPTGIGGTPGCILCDYLCCILALGPPVDKRSVAAETIVQRTSDQKTYLPNDRGPSVNKQSRRKATRCTKCRATHGWPFLLSAARAAGLPNRSRRGHSWPSEGEGCQSRLTPPPGKGPGDFRARRFFVYLLYAFGHRCKLGRRRWRWMARSFTGVKL